MSRTRCWAGVDVGARRKGFDAVVVDRGGLVAGPCRLQDPAEVAHWLDGRKPSVVAVDSPIRPAPNGEKSRPGESDLVKAGICGIRYTPDAATLNSHPTDYYGWILNGLKLYNELKTNPAWRVIECFPTASWTRLGWPRAGARRTRWSRSVLEELPMNQDARDAVAAALTARLHDEGTTEAFADGDLWVPIEGSAAVLGRRPEAVGTTA